MNKNPDPTLTESHEQTGHTPGPWDDASKYPQLPTVRIFAKSHYIATVGNPGDSREETEANARLIAAAPDLLEALKETVYQIRNSPIAWAEPIQKAEAAISKASPVSTAGSSQGKQCPAVRQIRFPRSTRRTGRGRKGLTF